MEWKTLGEVFDLKNGYTPSKSNSIILPTTLSTTATIGEYALIKTDFFIISEKAKASTNFSSFLV